MDSLDIIRKMRQRGTHEAKKAVTNEVTKRTKSANPFDEYTRALDAWQPSGPRDLPPDSRFEFPDPCYGPACALWWRAIDRRNREYRQGIHAP